MPPKGSKRQAIEHLSDISARDSKKIAQPDLKAPFSSIEDAVSRLLPYHILAEEDYAEADVREVKESGKTLPLNRNEAWLAQATKHTIDMQRNGWKLAEKIHTLNQTSLSRSHLASFVLHSYVGAEIRHDMKTEIAKREAITRKAAEEATQKFMAQQIAMKARIEEENRKTAAAAAAAVAAATQATTATTTAATASIGSGGGGGGAPSIANTSSMGVPTAHIQSSVPDIGSVAPPPPAPPSAKAPPTSTPASTTAAGPAKNNIAPPPAQAPKPPRVQLTSREKLLAKARALGK